jgi:glycosyltransferase involved in cell wall biosynthesis
MKILHVFGQMDRGGAELRTLDVYRATHPLGWRQDFCVLSGMTGVLDASIRDLGGEVIPLRIDDFVFALKFCALLRRGKYDAVHSHVHHASGYLLALARIARVKGRIAHYRSSGEQGAKSFVRKMQDLICKFLIRKNATDILSVSASALSLAWDSEWSSDHRCKVVYNGVHQFAFERSSRFEVFDEFEIPRSATLFVHVGRFVKPKNQHRCVAIFRELQLRNPNSYLMFVGKGDSPDERHVRAQIEAFGLGGNTRFAGVRTDVLRILAAADLMIFPSLWEGLPGAVLEAVSVGTPVLASDIPVIGEVAGQLGGVHQFALERSDLTWSLHAEKIVRDNTEVNRDILIDGFRKSPFAFGYSVQMQCRIWDQYKNV